MDLILPITLMSFFCGWIGWMLGERKGRGTAGFWLGFCLGFIGWVIIWPLKPLDKT